jgi:hypothetical protein
VGPHREAGEIIFVLGVVAFLYAVYDECDTLILCGR